MVQLKHKICFNLTEELLFIVLSFLRPFFRESLLHSSASSELNDGPQLFIEWFLC